MMMRRRQGMTLIEIIFAMAIVTTVLTLAYAAALGAWRNATAANQRTQAQYMIQQSIEAIKAYRETDNFDWNDFIVDVNGAGSVLRIGLEQADGSKTYNSFVCDQTTAAPGTPNECEFIIENGSTALTPVGANVNVASAGSFTLEIVPESYFLEGFPGTNSISAGGSLPNDTNISAVTFVVRATWTDANGIASNASASTIITEPR